MEGGGGGVGCWGVLTQVTALCLRPTQAPLLGVCESLSAVFQLGGCKHSPEYKCLEFIISLGI